MTEKDGNGFIVKYSNKDIMDKLNSMHNDVTAVRTRVKIHTKLIWAFGGCLFTMVIVIIRLHGGG